MGFQSGLKYRKRGCARYVWWERVPDVTHVVNSRVSFLNKRWSLLPRCPQQSRGEEMFPAAAEGLELHRPPSVREPEAAPAGERGAPRRAGHRQSCGRNERYVLTQQEEFRFVLFMRNDAGSHLTKQTQNTPGFKNTHHNNVHAGSIHIFPITCRTSWQWRTAFIFHSLPLWRSKVLEISRFYFVKKTYVKTQPVKQFRNSTTTSSSSIFESGVNRVSRGTRFNANDRVTSKI